MNRYQLLIKSYYKEIVTPKLKFWEVWIVAVSVAALLLGFYLQLQDYTLISMLNMLIAGFGVKHVMDNDDRRKLSKIKKDYERFCEKNGVRPIDPNGILTIADARKAWFCMAHRVGPKDLIEVAITIKGHYAAYRELESLNSITYGKAAKLLLWFDASRLLSLLAIIAALGSVVFLAGVSNIDPILEAFYFDIFPGLVLIAGFLFVAYFALLGFTPVLPAVLGVFDLVQAMGRSPVSDRAIRNYIYGLMRASD